MAIQVRSREQNMRRKATRQRLRLAKSKRRDERAYDYGAYWLLDGSNAIVNGDRGMTLDEIEHYLSGAA